MAALVAASVPALAQTSSPAAIALDPVCGPAGGAPSRYAVTVNGANFNPFAAVLVSFDFAVNGRPETFPGRTDGFGRFRLAIQPLRRSAGIYVVRAEDLRQREATATFTVPCSIPTEPEKPPERPPPEEPPGGGPGPEEPPGGGPGPEEPPGGGGGTTTTATELPTPPPPPGPALRLDPPIGPPGFVTAAVGTGFPPSAPVRLAWAPGLTFGGLIAVADSTGAFRVPVLVYRRDILGPRQLRATPAGDLAFAPATAGFLVVPGHGQPRDFRDRR